jgi:hypothetical protein
MNGEPKTSKTNQAETTRWRGVAAGMGIGAALMFGAGVAIVIPAIEDAERTRWEAAAETRSSMTGLCSAYREWSRVTGDNAPGMERLCG